MLPVNKSADQNETIIIPYLEKDYCSGSMVRCCNLQDVNSQPLSWGIAALPQVQLLLHL